MRNPINETFSRMRGVFFDPNLSRDLREAGYTLEKAVQVVALAALATVGVVFANQLFLVFAPSTIVLIMKLEHAIARTGHVLFSQRGLDYFVVITGLFLGIWISDNGS